MCVNAFRFSETYLEGPKACGCETVEISRLPLRAARPRLHPVAKGKGANCYRSWRVSTRGVVNSIVSMENMAAQEIKNSFTATYYAQPRFFCGLPVIVVSQTYL